MATLRIVASSYQLSNTSYTNISNPNNMYTNVDSTTYATFNHTRNQTTAYYLYIRGFDLSQIPSNATISSVIVKVKALVTGAGSYTPGLYNNTTSLNKNFNGTIGTSATTRTVDITSSWNTYKTYGNNLTIRLQLNRSNKNTASSMRIYGAEITVEYTVPTPRTITTSLTGNGTINPSGTTSVEDGESFVLSIDATGKVAVTDNGVDVTNKLVTNGTGSGVAKSAEFYPATYTTNGSISGTNYKNAIGHSSADYYPGTQSDYAYSGTVYVSYGFDFSSIPNNAIIKSIACTFAGHNENSEENMCPVQLYAGENPKGTGRSFSSDETYSLDMINCGTWTRSELDTMTLRVTLGYYGGLLCGATVTVNYELADASGGSSYTYTIASVKENHTINVVVTEDEAFIYLKENGTWQEYILYKKINGTWVKQLDPDSILDSSAKYLVVDL